MSATFKLHRSLMYVPPMHAPLLGPSRDADADVLCLDLEDSTPPVAKVAARAVIADYLAQGRPKARSVIVRVNALDTEWGHEDLRWALDQPIDGILLPKVDGEAIVRQARHVLGNACTLLIWCLIETPLGVLRAAEIAAAGVEGLVVGGSDLAEGLHARHVPSRLPVWHALSQVVLAARAFGISAIDANHVVSNDLVAFEEACRQSEEMGFNGRSLSSGAYVVIANRAFLPTEEDLARARKLLDGSGGYGAHIASARRLIAFHDFATSGSGHES